MDEEAAEALAEVGCRIVSVFLGTGKNLGVHAATACSSDESVGDHPVYLPSSPLISAQRAWSNISAPVLVQRICCFFSIRQSTSWSTVDSTRSASGTSDRLCVASATNLRIWWVRAYRCAHDMLHCPCSVRTRASEIWDCRNCAWSRNVSQIFSCHSATGYL